MDAPLAYQLSRQGRRLAPTVAEVGEYGL